jgi:NCS1 family nucleobase:cation symporter-1
LPFSVLVLRELDESFANVYSTVVSVQNLKPLADRRVLAVAIGTIATVGALALNIDDYQNFLYLIGSVFVPLAAVLVVDFFVLGRGHRWDTSDSAPARWIMVLPWALGFIAYQLINPGGIGWWVKFWGHVQSWIDFTPRSWMSASLAAFVVGGVLTFVIGHLQSWARQGRTD